MAAIIRHALAATHRRTVRLLAILLPPSISAITPLVPPAESSPPSTAVRPRHLLRGGDSWRQAASWRIPLRCAFSPQSPDTGPSDGMRGGQNRDDGRPGVGTRLRPAGWSPAESGDMCPVEGRP